MTRRLLALLTLALLAFMLVAPAVAALAAAADVETAHAWHADGTPCPDDDDHGGPCDDGCVCHCCHAHVLALQLRTPAPTGKRPPPDTVTPFGPPQTLHPNSYLDRVFRPPRG